jgi:hypothetical protein
MHASMGREETSACRPLPRGAGAAPAYPTATFGTHRPRETVRRHPALVPLSEEHQHEFAHARRLLGAAGAGPEERLHDHVRVEERELFE